MLCDRYGLDSISTGCAIAFAMECFEKRLISIDDTNGVEMKFGNHQAITEMIPLIASRVGFGNLLAQGVKRISEKIGNESERFAMHVKGLELGGYDPRGVQGQGVSMATSCRGGCHGKGGYMVAFEAFMGAVDRFATSGKGKIIKMVRLRSIQGDSLNLCAHGARAIRGDLRLKLLSAVIGLDLTEEELTLICERIDNVERAFNVREGFTREDDTLPWRLLNEPMPDGPAKGIVASIENNLDEFYEISGWNKATGIPTRAKLESLNLQYIAGDLGKIESF
jgi:aldehyde:ferredoxin oxidoreductase